MGKGGAEGGKHQTGNFGRVRLRGTAEMSKNTTYMYYGTRHCNKGNTVEPPVTGKYSDKFPSAARAISSGVRIFTIDL